MSQKLSLKMREKYDHPKIGIQNESCDYGTRVRDFDKQGSLDKASDQQHWKDLYEKIEGIHNQAKISIVIISGSQISPWSSCWPRSRFIGSKSKFEYKK